MQDILIVVDLQNGVCFQENSKLDHLDELIEFANQQIQNYRQAQRPVLFVQHEEEGLVYGTQAWELHPDLEAQATDLFVRKTHANSFFKTSLQEVLQEHQIQCIEWVGAQTEFCMDGSIKFAHGLGYQNVLYHQATTTYASEGLSATEIIQWYEKIWQNRYAQILPLS
jgi:nicotinamidase-related amidase